MAPPAPEPTLLRRYVRVRSARSVRHFACAAPSAVALNGDDGPCAVDVCGGDGKPPRFVDGRDDAARDWRAVAGLVNDADFRDYVAPLTPAAILAFRRGERVA